MPFVEDVSLYFAEFGNPATLDGAAVQVIFDAPTEQDFAGVGGGVLVSLPQVHLATSSVPASPEGKTLVLDSLSYVVREHIPDGSGVSLLMLTAA